MKTKENLLPGQMDIFQLFDTGFGMTTDEKIVKYLFDTKEVCVFAGWFSNLKKLYLSGGNLQDAVKEIFSDCVGNDWSNVIFKNHSNLDFSELDHRRVGVQYKLNGIVINYNGAYQEKRLWKYIRMSFADIAAEVEKRIA